MGHIFFWCDPDTSKIVHALNNSGIVYLGICRELTSSGQLLDSMCFTISLFPDSKQEN